MSPQPSTKWYHSLWFVLLMLLFVLGPFGLPLVWKNPNFSRPVKAGLTALTVLYTLLLLGGMLHAVRAVLDQLGSVL